MTPNELKTAILSVIPGEEPVRCKQWAIAAKVVPESRVIRYTASLVVSNSFDLPYALLEYAGSVEDELHTRAEDLCEMDSRVRALSDEMGREAKGTDDGIPGPETGRDPGTEH